MFKFYFQSGHFTNGDDGIASHLWDLGIEACGTLAGFGLAYLLYLWQSRTEDEVKKTLENRANDNLLFYCHRLFTGAITFTNALGYSIKDSINKVNADPFFSIDISVEPYDDLVRVVERIDQKACVFAYRAQLKDFQIVSIFNAFDYINLLRLEIVPFVKESRNLDHARKLQLAEQVRNLRRDMMSPGVVSNDVQQIFSKIVRVKLTTDEEWATLQESLIAPILTNTYKITKNAENGAEILRKTEAIVATFIEIKNQNLEKAKELDRMYKNLETALHHIISNSGPIERYVAKLSQKKEFRVQEFEKLQTDEKNHVATESAEQPNDSKAG